MPQETKSKFQPGPPSAPPAAAPTLQGWAVDLTDPDLTMSALDKAFDFRGDVTLTLADGRNVTGYIFDRRKGRTLADSSVRLMTASSDDKVRVAYSDIRRLDFGKDAAHGKSFETWVKKYIEKKLKGERASIESEPTE